ncbi:MAG: proline dehydrogenase family protein, partial [Acidimicrobiia bacterium]
MVERFVAGDLLDDALRTARELRSLGISSILDYLGEHCTSSAQADAILQSYTSHLKRVAAEEVSGHISVKLTQLGLDLSFDDCLRRAEALCRAAESEGVTVAIDMDSHEYTESTIEIYGRLRTGHSKLVLCLQSYLRRTAEDVQ